MNLKNGYKIIYEKAGNGKRTFYASKTNICNPAVDTKIGETYTDSNYAGKIIYEYNGKFYVSTGKTPAYDATGEPTDTCLTAFDLVFVEQEEDPEQEGNPEGGQEGGPEGGQEGNPEGGQEGEPEGGQEGEPEGKQEGEPEGGPEENPELEKEPEEEPETNPGEE